MDLLKGDPKGDLIKNEIQSEYSRVKEAYSRNEDEEGTRLFLQMATGNPHFLDNLPPFDQEIIN